MLIYKQDFLEHTDLKGDRKTSDWHLSGCTNIILCISAFDIGLILCYEFHS